MSIEHKTVIMGWEDTKSNATTTLTIHDVTKSEALEAAKQQGYVAPKWYQFWKPKIQINCFGF